MAGLSRGVLWLLIQMQLMITNGRSNSWGRVTHLQPSIPLTVLLSPVISLQFCCAAVLSVKALNQADFLLLSISQKEGSCEGAVEGTLEHVGVQNF